MGDRNNADALAVHFSGGRLKSRRVELAYLEDQIESIFERGWTEDACPHFQSSSLGAVYSCTRKVAPGYSWRLSVAGRTEKVAANP